jgi:precorrin-2 dehydrogenase / sirohydrochlorin ferrochelatase
MPVFPIFVDLEDKKCVVIGGGNVATRKIDTLLTFNPCITVISPEISDRIQQLKLEGKVTVLNKKYSEGDLEDAFITIAAASDTNVNERVYKEAIKRNIHVNIADCPDKCTFIFPSIVSRCEVVVGISTSGSFPAMSKYIRQSVEKALPKDLSQIIQILKDFRKRAVLEIKSLDKRKELINRLIDEVAFFKNDFSEERIRLRIEEIFEEYKDE